MSRVIRNDRARELQGCRAGIVSRSLAFAIDIGIAFLIYLGIVAGLSLAWDLAFSDKLEVPTPPGWVNGVAIFVVLVTYLTLGWGSTGRTLGKQLMGLRVVRDDATSLRPRAAFARAFVCAIFYPGLLVALVDRRNRSLQDIVCRTVVVYDWVPEGARPSVLPTQATASTARSSGEAGS